LGKKNFHEEVSFLSIFTRYELISLDTNKMWKYLLLTALTFYVLSPGVLFVLPSVGPVPSLALHAVLFAVVHKYTHKFAYA